jgi:hypothetical protein
MTNEPTLPPAGWYADPEQPQTQRYWTGSEWTDQRAPMKLVAQSTASPVQSEKDWPTWLHVGLTAVVALALGIGIGLVGEETQLEEDLARAERERDRAERALATVQAGLRQARADARRAEAQTEQARAQTEQAREAAAAAEQPPAVDTASSGEEGSGGTYTDGDFTISDVQVTEDFIGEFEIRARVTNNGDPAEFVDLQATLFNEGSVVSDLEALEDFEAGQTRTVTFIGTDKYGPWDEIEFTVDKGF